MSHPDYIPEITFGDNKILVDEEVMKWKAETPVPLRKADLQPLPPDTFEGWFGEMVDAVSRSLEVPIGLPGMLGLAAIATTVQGKFSLLVEEGYFQQLNFWGITAMDPSNRKSAAVKLIDRTIAKMGTASSQSSWSCNRRSNL